MYARQEVTLLSEHLYTERLILSSLGIYSCYYTVPEGEGLLFIQFLRAKIMFIVSIETMGLKIVINQSLALHAI